MNGRPLNILHLSPPQKPEGGDYVYRLKQPCEALGALPGALAVCAFNLLEERVELALEADALVLKLLGDPDLLPVVAERRRLGRPTVFEISDDFLDFQPANPAYRQYENPERRAALLQLASLCDATQTTSRGLAERYAFLNPRQAVFENQMATLGTIEKPDGPFTAGWGGSVGHRADVEWIAPALNRWIRGRPGARLALMCHESFLDLFAGTAEEQIHWRPPGTIGEYYAFLQSLHVGLAPVLDHPFNKGRSDVKFIECASRGAVFLCADSEPYRGRVKNGGTGLLFGSPEDMTRALDRLADDAPFRLALARNAFEEVKNNRMESAHAGRRLEFYRSLFPSEWSRGNLNEDRIERSDALARSPGRAAWFHVLREGEQAAHDAMALNRENDRAGALALSAAALKIRPDGYDGNLLHGSLSVAKDPVRAMTALKRAVRKWPSGPQARLWLARVEVAAGEKATAVETLKTIRKKCPLFAPAYYDAARLAYEEGDLPAVRRLLLDAVEANPYYAPAMTELGRLCAAGNEWSDAKRFFEDALRWAPRMEAALLGAAEAAITLKATGEAEEHALNALEAAPSPETVAGAVNVCKALHKSGALERAERFLQRALTIKEEDPTLTFWRMRTLRRLGRVEEAARLKNGLKGSSGPA